MKVISFFAVVAALCLLSSSVSALSATHSTSECTGTNNTIPVVTAAPTFVKNVTNGKMYVAGEGNDTFHVLHLWGTPYEQGFAQGQLRAKELNAVWGQFEAYLLPFIEKKLKGELPEWLVKLFDEYGAPVLLQWAFSNTKPYTPKMYLDEMQGIADGANMSVEVIQNLNMFPELTKAACTIVGANHDATPGRKIQHLRALDFSPHCPIKDYPQVTVYHGNKGTTVANVGWAGLVGSLTGISNRSIGIGEKVWLDHKHVSGVHGQPWMFILRDVLMTKNITEALDTIKNAKKTCAIHAGVGDSTTNTFRGVKMAKNAFLVYNWSSINYTPGHPALEGIMYWNKYEQPSHNTCLSGLLQNYYGEITAENLALNIAPTFETGNMHAVTFDYEAQIAFIANAQKTYVSTGNLNAYARQFTKLNLTALWVEEQF